MNKAQLIDSISQKLSITKKDSEKFLNAFIETVTESLESNEKIQLVGFGSFEVKHRAPRQGRNPKKPENTIHIPATKTAVFKPGKGLKELLNK